MIRSLFKMLRLSLTLTLIVYGFLALIPFLFMVLCPMVGFHPSYLESVGCCFGLFVLAI